MGFYVLRLPMIPSFREPACWRAGRGIRLQITLLLFVRLSKSRPNGNMIFIPHGPIFKFPYVPQGKQISNFKFPLSELLAYLKNIARKKVIPLSA